MTVHLNDQNGIRYDQDKSFGVENLRAAFNQVRVLKENDLHATVLKRITLRVPRNRRNRWINGPRTLCKENQISQFLRLIVLHIRKQLFPCVLILHIIERALFAAAVIMPQNIIR